MNWNCMMPKLVCFICLLCVSANVFAEDFMTIEPEFLHLRNGETREWASFPKEPIDHELKRTFQSDANATVWTLSVRQQDVKEGWDVVLNEKRLGRLVRDENDMRTDFEIPAGVIVDGENVVYIHTTKRAKSDDVRVGDIQIYETDPKSLRQAAMVEITITDEQNKPMPGRITIVNDQATLMPIGAESQVGTAIRNGVVYTNNGNTQFGLAPGSYRIYGGKGFEYSVAQTQLTIQSGDEIKKNLQLRREVNTTGWVACDTHMHTLTHSGHGDCTIEERMVTLAGEGVELAIATDHNKHVDFRPAQHEADLDLEFTPVIGNEVSTSTGHFCIFPIAENSMIPDFRENDWNKLFDSIYATPEVRVAIINHAQDIHKGFRPFSPRHHLSLTGENIDNRPQRYNAVEVINSGAVKTDPKLLFHDWCGLMNRGLNPTPVGGSDSHDVSRYIVGQGRTYIRCNDTNSGKIPLTEAVDAFLDGHVVVSYGLLANLTVNGNHIPGDLVPLGDDDLEITLEVFGPSWTQVNSVELYLCGRSQFEDDIQLQSQLTSTPKCRRTWRIPRKELTHDVWLSAVAIGPGITAPFWPTAKPYQPDSQKFDPYVFSSTGAVRIDVDGDGKFSSPHDYAEGLIEKHNNDHAALLLDLNKEHVSVVHQVASHLHASGTDIEELQKLATGTAKSGFQEYREALRRSIIARLEEEE